ncbi:SH2 domain-containing protein 4A [Corythoichthys intestinalis]|uniref:SH2 domain-containing protein 4A n=1 Tax=Corythoichthys intestinalis TaxID=161448 RepID=UPI0025A5C176|nr:SH2 domain-containing protein 4A [Corythoichthys intestinalis]XP_057707164.1 SH2 domain-containing protein 4A [Corythoichthys intestinalis]XP_061793193.1 SH2 domain-containing protein 4A-like [Nerophis lumbriciformis]
MLAKILEEMWVEPEVLEALSEEQKRILFLKMREEQVRRWREWEEREGENIGRSRPKKATSKHVSWLLGRDGDVCVRVIGEMDEFRSSKLLHNIFNERLHCDSMNGIQTADMQAGKMAQQLGFKKESHLAFTEDTTSGCDSPNSHSSQDEMDSDCADDDPKDPGEGSDSESGSSSDNLSDWAPLRGPHLSRHGNKPALKTQLFDAEMVSPQARDVLWVQEKKLEYGGRVAQLRKAFGSGPSDSFSKSPLPAKPAQLLTRRMSLIH